MDVPVLVLAEHSAMGAPPHQLEARHTQAHGNSQQRCCLACFSVRSHCLKRQCSKVATKSHTNLPMPMEARKAAFAAVGLCALLACIAVGLQERAMRTPASLLAVAGKQALYG